MHKEKEKIAFWLWMCAAMVIVMIGIGGYTRLTGSGLSIVDWQPIAGIIPPLSHESWLSLFSQYQLFPEFIQVNSQMTLEEFKFIYMVEFIHRFWGRAMGFVLLIPTYYAIVYCRDFLPRILGVWFLAGMQGFMGWYMVKSGLVDDPQVSPIRLTLHLLLAMTILGYLLKTIYSLQAAPLDERDAQLRLPFVVLASSMVLTICYGGLTAGSHAGWIYNTFPWMNGRALPEHMFVLTPWFKNLFYNPGTIQWVHRVLAFLSLGVGIYVWVASMKSDVSPGLKKVSALIAFALTMQVLLGVTTLVLQVPVGLGVAHQVWASLTFAVVFWGALLCGKSRVMQAVTNGNA